VLTGYLVWLALLLAIYYGRPGLQVEAGGLFDLSGGLAIVAGVVINRPARKTPWLLLAGATLTLAAGQISFLFLTEVMKTKVPFPSFADGFYLATYPLYAAGMLIFIWSRSPDRDRRSLIDALTLTVGLALLSWIYLILPYVHNPGLTWLQKSVAIAYPLGDVLVLAMIARLIVPGTARTRSVQLLTLGTVGLLASDVAFGLEQLHGSFHAGSGTVLGWAVFYGAWGAAGGPAPEHVRADPPGGPAAGRHLTLQADRADARVVYRPGRLVHPVGHRPESRRRRDRGVLRRAVPAGALAAVGSGGLAPPRPAP
jgi:hypothetical protein